MKRSRDEMIKKFAEEMQIPENAVTDTYTIEFRGTTDVTVEGCFGIVEYEGSMISLNLGKKILRFSGCDLEISSFCEQRAVIKGTVASMEFSS